MPKQKQRIRRPKTATQAFNLDGRITVPGSARLADAPNAAFSTEKTFRANVTNWTGQQLVDVWNALPGTKRVRRFADRETAMRRIWRVIQELRREAAAGLLTVAPSVDPERGTVQSKERTKPRALTKTARIVALLERPSGASLKAIIAVTGWQPRSVRGFISAQLSKRMGLKIQSLESNGERVYRIVTRSRADQAESGEGGRP